MSYETIRAKLRFKKQAFAPVKVLECGRIRDASELAGVRQQSLEKRRAVDKRSYPLAQARAGVYKPR